MWASISACFIVRSATSEHVGNKLHRFRNEKGRSSLNSRQLGRLSQVSVRSIIWPAAWHETEWLGVTINSFAWIYRKRWSETADKKFSSAIKKHRPQCHSSERKPYIKRLETYMAVTSKSHLTLLLEAYIAHLLRCKRESFTLVEAVTNLSIPENKRWSTGTSASEHLVQGSHVSPYDAWDELRIRHLMRPTR